MLHGKCTIKILNKLVLEFDKYSRILTKKDSYKIRKSILNL